LDLDIDLFGHVPAEVEKPPPTSLTERATFARPLPVVFPSPVFQHPRNRSKKPSGEKAACLFLSLPTNILDISQIP